jgi:hypothetical protein
MGGEGKEDKPFSIIDKRKRVEEERPEKTEPPAEPSPCAPAEETHSGSAAAKAPPINFSTFILSLSSSAVYHMGGFQDPYSGKTSMNLELAKQTIDIIALLEAKTRGNLAPDEQKLITHALYDLRMRYVELADKTDGAPPTP